MRNKWILHPFEEKVPRDNVASIKLGNKWYDINVSSLIEYIKKNKIPIQRIPLSTLPKEGGWDDLSTIKVGDPNNKGTLIPLSKLSKDEQDKELVRIKKDIMKTELKYPIIILVDKMNKPKAVLDGNHRVSKAKIQGIKDLPAHLLTNKDIASFLSLKEYMATSREELIFRNLKQVHIWKELCDLGYGDPHDMEMFKKLATAFNSFRDDNGYDPELKDFFMMLNKKDTIQ